jgi:hypothetical protein
MAICVNECGSVDSIGAPPINRERGIRFLDVDRFGVAIAGEPCGKLVGNVQQPRITGLGREQNMLTDANDPTVVVGGSTLDVARFIGETEALAVQHAALAATLVPLLAVSLVAPLSPVLLGRGARPALITVAGAVWMPGLGAALSSIGFGAILAFSALLFAGARLESDLTPL